MTDGGFPTTETASGVLRSLGIVTGISLARNMASCLDQQIAEYLKERLVRGSQNEVP